MFKLLVSVNICASLYLVNMFRMCTTRKIAKFSVSNGKFIYHWPVVPLRSIELHRVSSLINCAKQKLATFTPPNLTSKALIAGKLILGNGAYIGLGNIAAYYYLVNMLRMSTTWKITKVFCFNFLHQFPPSDSIEFHRTSSSFIIH